MICSIEAESQGGMSEYEKAKMKKRKMLNFCLTFGHKIQPSIAIWFVISYWMAGMFEYYMIDSSITLIVEIVFSLVFFTSLVIINQLVVRLRPKT